MVVIDTNIIVGMVLTQENHDTIKRLYKRDPDWVAPSLWRYETCNAMLKYERYLSVPRELLMNAFNEAEAIINSSELKPSIDHILDCAARTGLSGYDATYVALAEDLNVPLYTYDKGILKACPELTRKP